MGIYLIKQKCKKTDSWMGIAAGELISWQIVRPATILELQNHTSQWTDNGDGTVTYTNVTFDTYIDGLRYGMPDASKEIKNQLELFD